VTDIPENCNEPTCGMCSRVDSVYINEEWAVAQIITYLDDVAVVTDMNPETEVEDFEIVVLHVQDGTVSDYVQAGLGDGHLWRQIHDEFWNVQSAHDMVVEAVKNGLIQL